MIEEAFEVATEFKFDVGQAVFNTNALTQSVNQLSESATGALNSLQYLAGGLVAHLGLGSGGLLSILTQSVELSEQFHVGMMGFVNSIGSNFNVLSGHVQGFNEQLESSQMLMNTVGGVATKYGLSSGELARMTQLFASPLAQRGKLGTNFANGIELAKNSMLVGEQTGLGTQMMGESLLRALSPGGALMGKAFERAVNTQAFRSAGIQHPQQLSNMMPDRKIDLLTKAFSELGNNAGYLSERLNSITVQFNMMKNYVSNLLTPIGNALREPMLKIFKGLNDFLSRNATEIGGNIAKIIADIFKNPRELLVNLMQMRDVGSNFHSSVKIAEMFLTLRFISQALGWLGIELNGGLLRAGFSYLISAFKWLAGIIPWATIFNFAMRMLMTVLVEFVPILLGAFLLLQGLSKAKAQARVSDVEDLAAMTPRITKDLFIWKKLLQEIWTPFEVIIDSIANSMEWFFKWSNYVKIFLSFTELIVPVLDDIGRGFVQLAADLIGFSAVFKDILTGNLTNIPGDFMKARTNYINETEKRLGGPGESVAKVSVYNTNNINANFNIREQLEPDRVAFAVTDHLKKLVMDRTQAQGGSIYAGLAKPQGAIIQ